MQISFRFDRGIRVSLGAGLGCRNESHFPGARFPSFRSDLSQPNAPQSERLSIGGPCTGLWINSLESLPAGENFRRFGCWFGVLSLWGLVTAAQQNKQ